MFILAPYRTIRYDTVRYSTYSALLSEAPLCIEKVHEKVSE